MCLTTCDAGNTRVRFTPATRLPFGRSPYARRSGRRKAGFATRRHRARGSLQSRASVCCPAGAAPGTAPVSGGRTGVREGRRTDRSGCSRLNGRTVSRARPGRVSGRRTGPRYRPAKPWRSQSAPTGPAGALPRARRPLMRQSLPFAPPRHVSGIRLPLSGGRPGTLPTGRQATPADGHPRDPYGRNTRHRCPCVGRARAEHPPPVTVWAAHTVTR